MYVYCSSRILISQSLRVGSAGDHMYCLTSPWRLSPYYYMDWLAHTPIVRRLYCLAHRIVLEGPTTTFGIGTRYLGSSINSPHVVYLYAK